MHLIPFPQDGHLPEWRMVARKASDDTRRHASTAPFSMAAFRHRFTVFGSETGARYALTSFFVTGVIFVKDSSSSPGRSTVGVGARAGSQFF